MYRWRLVLARSPTPAVDSATLEEEGLLGHRVLGYRLVFIVVAETHLRDVIVRDGGDFQVV
jgi:hypothetical protein